MLIVRTNSHTHTLTEWRQRLFKVCFRRVRDLRFVHKHVIEVELTGGGWEVNLHGFAESGRQWETVGDSGRLLLRVFSASAHERETLGAIRRSNRKQ